MSFVHFVQLADNFLRLYTTSNTYLNSDTTFSKFVCLTFSNFGFNVFISRMPLSKFSSKFHMIFVQCKSLGSGFKYNETFWIFIISAIAGILLQPQTVYFFSVQFFVRY